jgi:hypothetical protein
MKNPESNRESEFKLTEEEFLLWLKPFRFGQSIFDRHVGNADPVTPLHLCPSYNGENNVICYVEEKDCVIVSFQLITDLVAHIKKYKQTLNGCRRTNAHLIRLGVCTTPDAMAIFTGIEERAHAYFHKHVKETLNAELSYTGKYDGSDSSEEYAFREMSKIILNNRSLPLYPLPSNFYEFIY